MKRNQHASFPQLRCARRNGAAAVELACVLPLLLTLACGAMDFARVYYYSQIIADCARTGAMYAANPDLADATDFDTIEAATLASAAGFDSTPTVTTATSTDTAGNTYVSVTVSYSFPLLTRFIGLTSPQTISHTVHARLYPSAQLN